MDTFSAHLDSPAFRRALQLASEAHSGQLRMSGEASITHPYAVAEMLAHHGADSTTLSAAILHDVVEDTPVCVGEIRHDFGWRVAELVMLMSKPSDDAQPPIMQILTDKRTPRYSALLLHTLYLKFFDRLHNLKTISALPPERQVRMADETIDVLYPAALDVDPRIARVLHELSFKVLSGICCVDGVRRTSANFVLHPING
jgi:guanosine-3',5'-bis(diphosphate) 3'-pyrophosphohydrolase